jgi:hypothetical protein
LWRRFQKINGVARPKLVRLLGDPPLGWFDFR